MSIVSAASQYVAGQGTGVLLPLHHQLTVDQSGDVTFGTHDVALSAGGKKDSSK